MAYLDLHFSKKRPISKFCIEECAKNLNYANKNNKKIMQ